MTQLAWDAPANYYAGVDRGVFYPIGGTGIAWNGLVSVKEAEDTTSQAIIYIDGLKKVNQLGLGSFSATIDALTYPDEFLPYDGYAEFTTGQARPLFNFLYRVQNGDTAYQLHLVYNCQAAPTPLDNQSLSNAIVPETFSWNLSTTPIPVPDARASAHFILDSQLIDPSILTAIENLLYGTDTSDPTCPTTTDLLAIFETYALYIVVDNGDGSWTATGPDEAFDVTSDGYFTLDWPWVKTIDADTYAIKSF